MININNYKKLKSGYSIIVLNDEKAMLFEAIITRIKKVGISNTKVEYRYNSAKFKDVEKDPDGWFIIGSDFSDNVFVYFREKNLETLLDSI
jgi:hypothetical protein